LKAVYHKHTLRPETLYLSFNIIGRYRQWPENRGVNNRLKGLKSCSWLANMSVDLSVYFSIQNLQP